MGSKAKRGRTMPAVGCGDQVSGPGGGLAAGAKPRTFPGRRHDHGHQCLSLERVVTKARCVSRERWCVCVLERGLCLGEKASGMVSRRRMSLERYVCALERGCMLGREPSVGLEAEAEQGVTRCLHKVVADNETGIGGEETKGWNPDQNPVPLLQFRVFSDLMFIRSALEDRRC